MNKYLSCFLFLFFYSQLLAVDTPVDKLLKTAKGLSKNPADTESFAVLRNQLDNFSENSVKSSIIKVLSYAQLSNDKNSFGDFQRQLSEKYPWFDFSKISLNEANYNEKLNMAVKFLALNACNAQENTTGLPLSKISLKPNASRKISKPEVIASKTPEKELTTPITTKEFETKVEEAQQTKVTDIAFNTPYYKIYQAASKAQKGETEGIRELVDLTFSDGKPDELTAAVVKTMVLGMLDSNSKSLNPYMIKVNSIYPDNTYLGFLDKEPVSLPCKLCNAKGFRENPCRQCSNGVCRNCKGEGTITYRGLGAETSVNKTCPTCKGKKTCIACEGTKVEKKNCTNCAGRGGLIDKNSFKPEYAKSMQYLIDLTPKLAEEANVYIGVGINSKAVARIEEVRKQQRRYQEEELARIKAEKERELAALEVERKKKTHTTEEGNGPQYVVTENEKSSGGNGNMSGIEYARMEFENYLKAQERRTKSSLYSSVTCKFANGKAMLYVDVPEEFVRNNSKDYKTQILEGYYRFWQLRAGANGAGSNVDIVMTAKGQEVAGTNNGTAYFK